MFENISLQQSACLNSECQPGTYHPVFGSHADTYHDTRWSLLKQRLPFPLRKRLVVSTPEQSAREEV
jgi:hypothetical protein